MMAGIEQNQVIGKQVPQNTATRILYISAPEDFDCRALSSLTCTQTVGCCDTITAV